VLVHVSFQQWNVWLVRKNVEIPRCQIKELVVFLKMEKIVTKIDNYISV